MSSNKKYWRSDFELNGDSKVIESLGKDEFTEDLPVVGFYEDKNELDSSNASRRDFLKWVGFSTAAATVAACEGPIKKSVPYVVQPDEIVPGVANYYATSISNGYDFASVLVKTREGRPIKVENNESAEVLGGANARVQASVLSLYDKNRIQGPMANGAPIEWNNLDTAVAARLNALADSDQKVVLVSHTKSSPSYNRLVALFAEKYDNFEHLVYDAISSDSSLSAFEQRYGVHALADYDFSKADVIISFDADFLGDWQGGGYSKGYTAHRKPENGKMSHHIQLESNMTLSGSNADKRIPLSQHQQKITLAKLYNTLKGQDASGGSDASMDAYVSAMASKVKAAGSKAVVVCGLDDQMAQYITLAINEMIQSEAFDTNKPRYTAEGSLQKWNALLDDMEASRVGMLLLDGVNPLYNSPDAERFQSAMSKVGFTVSSAFLNNETASASTFVAAASHFMESWGDMQVKAGFYGLTQPVIRELFDTRQFEACLLKWAGVEESYYDFVRQTWETTILEGSSWNKALQDGVFVRDENVSLRKSVTEADQELSASRSLSNTRVNDSELVLYAKTGMGDGSQANNPWLQEFPDPITRTSWDNYLTVSKTDAEKLGLVNEYVANGGLDGSYAKITVGEQVLENVPVIVQPGQAVGTFGLAFGYGRKSGIQTEMQTGVNAFKLYLNNSKSQQVKVEKMSGMHEFACVQLQRTLMGRGDIIKETDMNSYLHEDAAVWNKIPQVSLDHQEVPASSVDLWDSFDRSVGHHFNMSIDLNACTGCGACVIACHAENNVPVVGKREIRVSRDMHWLRIDRYYSSEESFEADNEKKEDIDGLFGSNGSLGGFGELENPSNNPQVAFQPVMCQHCNHAPCETVCPVAATSHSRQGQNHMAYNRCIGTRYCANNCPYKVRRFNWFLYNQNDEFDFNMNNDLGRMVLNPDVNVRSRGVMEKCSMCIQRTQKTILDAKRDGRAIKDGEFNTACSAACDNGAIVFGDVNDHESEIAHLKENNRMYHLLEHVGTQPNVFYQVKVRNTEEA